MTPYLVGSLFALSLFSAVLFYCCCVAGAQARATGINRYIVRNPTAKTVTIISWNDYTTQNRRNTIEFVAFHDKSSI